MPIRTGGRKQPKLYALKRGRMTCECRASDPTDVLRKIEPFTPEVRVRMFDFLYTKHRGEYFSKKTYAPSTATSTSSTGTKVYARSHTDTTLPIAFREHSGVSFPRLCHPKRAGGIERAQISIQRSSLLARGTVDEEKFGPMGEKRDFVPVYLLSDWPLGPAFSFVSPRHSSKSGKTQVSPAPNIMVFVNDLGNWIPPGTHAHPPDLS